MGMYDTITVLGDDPRFLGLDVFQTKDLDCNLADYYIISGRLFQRGEKEGNTKVRETPQGLLLVKEYALTPVSPIEKAVIYTSNRNLLPVLSFRDSGASFGWDMVAEHYPHVELVVEFKAGEVVEVKVLENSSREELRQDLLKRGLEVLEDTDRVAVRHFKKRQERHERR